MALLSSMPDSRRLKSLILRSTYIDRVVASKDRHPVPTTIFLVLAAVTAVLAFSASLATKAASTELPTKILRLCLRGDRGWTKFCLVQAKMPQNPSIDRLLSHSGFPGERKFPQRIVELLLPTYRD